MSILAITKSILAIILGILAIIIIVLPSQTLNNIVKKFF